MTILRDLSILWCLVHVLVIFMFLFESRFSKKKTRILTLCIMGPIALFNTWFFVRFGPEATGQAMLLILTLPSFIFFWVLAKHRDGRFLFTFCLADTISLEIIYLTNLLDFFLPYNHYIVMFLIRLAAFPLLEWAILKWLQGP